ncbi:unnamed protein product [Triticum turgidum subsp. durum]|uniref:Uncharacterized protein n=1 Tax=Triticum turgidum subsp. durum TaxID=4567 RepID=A0A9R1AEA1_TRITD|nr:unnamed protein product [Triticum turgidum subsp. durum]
MGAHQLSTHAHIIIQVTASTWKACRFQTIPLCAMGNNNSTSSVSKPIPETSSRCLTECATAAHNFEVTRYSLLEGMGVGKFVSSSTFSVGSYGWDIRIYPDGWEEEDKAAYMSVFLCFFRSVGTIRGWPRFTDKCELKELLLRDDDCFTIRCVLTVIKEPRTEDLSTTEVSVPQSDLHTHFANMLKDGLGVDVTFSVGGQLFTAHRCVLAARSSVFKAELFGPMKESTMKCIKIDDMEPSVFEALLHFIYTDSLPSDLDQDQNVELQHLLVAADRYGLERLKAMCQGKLCQKIDVQTVATTLALAEQHHAAQLKNACLRYLSSQEVLRAVKETDGFKHLTASCPWIMDILEKVAPPSGV